MFYKDGLANGCRQLFLDYIWYEKFSAQFGYAFSLLHTDGYSLIACQEMNLYYHYPEVYWNCAVLLMNSNSIEKDTPEELGINVKEKGSDSGEVAKAIGMLQNNDVVVSLPDINEAEQGFKIDEATNSIMFGLKGISGINNEMAQFIINGRPFASLEDFHNRMVLVKREVVAETGKVSKKSLVGTSATINLIKAGAFDKLENRPREEILEDYIDKLLDDKIITGYGTIKQSLTTVDIRKVEELGLLGEDYNEEMRMVNFRECVMTFPKVKKEEEDKKANWVLIEDEEDYETVERISVVFNEEFAPMLQQGIDYDYNDMGSLMIEINSKKKASFNKIYENKVERLVAYLKTEECLQACNSKVREDAKLDKMQGNKNSWMMEVCGYYEKGFNEFDCVEKDKYNLTKFSELPENPEIVRWNENKNGKFPIFKINRICGTILAKNKNKNTLSLLTPEGEVITVKMQQGQFNFYDRVISYDTIDEKGKKKKVTVEKSWLTRGNLVFLNGMRTDEETFRCKSYNNHVLGKHVMSLIKKINDDGMVYYDTERARLDDIEELGIS